MENERNMCLCLDKYCAFLNTHLNNTNNFRTAFPSFASELKSKEKKEETKKISQYLYQR